MRALTTGQAAELNRMPGGQIGTRVRNLELAGVPHLQTWADPAVAAAEGILADYTLANGAISTLLTGFSQPDYARRLNVKCTRGGGAAQAGNVVITGTNIDGATITETIALNDDATVTGTKAFESITSIVLPARTNAGDVVRVGTTDALGADILLPYSSVLLAFLGGTREGTLPTVTVDADETEKCLIDLNSALNGTQVDVLLWDFNGRV